MNPKVTVYKREKRADKDPDVEQHPWQADIVLDTGENHHGVGASASEAMLNAALHWRKYDARREESAAAPARRTDLHSPSAGG